MRPLHRPLAALAVALAVPLLAGCGFEERTVGELPGQYLYIGNPEPLIYQVQISRQLDVAAATDSQLLTGVAPADRVLAEGESWFAVFINVENVQDEPLPSARSFEIHDTQENVFSPVPLSDENAFAYEPRTLDPGETIPTANSPAGQTDVNGELLLFKLPVDTIQNNRPLELIIESPKVPQDEGSSVLDV